MKIMSFNTQHCLNYLEKKIDFELMARVIRESGAKIVGLNEMRGAGEIATAFRLNESVAEILTGIILFFIIGSEFFVSYKVNFRRAHKEGKIKND